jgi:hypothetical protein
MLTVQRSISRCTTGMAVSPSSSTISYTQPTAHTVHTPRIASTRTLLTETHVRQVLDYYDSAVVDGLDKAEYGEDPIM